MATVGKLVFVGKGAVSVGVGLVVGDVDTRDREVEDMEGDDEDELEDDRLGVLLLERDLVE